MAFAYWSDQRWVEIVGPFVIGGVSYQSGWAEGATDADRAKLKIRMIAEPADPPSDRRVVGAEIVDTSDGPARHWITEAYSIQEAVVIVWNRAKTMRDLQCQGGCDTPFGRVDTTDASKIDVAGAVLMAVLAKGAGKPFSIDWTMADNTVQQLDADGMIALGVAVCEHRQVCQYAGTEIRSVIDQAAAKPGATAADVFAVDIAAGYP